MTGTMHGLLVYRIQDVLFSKGHRLNYDDLSDAIATALLSVAREEMEVGDSVELPNGAVLEMTWKPQSTINH